MLAIRQLEVQGNQSARSAEDYQGTYNVVAGCPLNDDLSVARQAQVDLRISTRPVSACCRETCAGLFAVAMPDSRKLQRGPDRVPAAAESTYNCSRCGGR